MATFDLDAAREERREARKKAGIKPPTLKHGGKTFTLADELPFALVEGMVTNDEKSVALGIKQLLGDAYDEFLETSPASDDVLSFAISALAVYNAGGPGEPKSNGKAKKNRN